MKRSKDEEKDDVAVSNATANNNNTKTSNNASPNASQSSNSNDGNNSSAIGSGSGGTTGTVRTTGRVKKPKLVYDPSDNYISRGPRNSLPAPTSAHVQGTSPTVNTSTNQAQSFPQPLPSQLNLSNQQPQSALTNGGEVAPQSVANSTTSEEAKDRSTVHTAEQPRNFDTCMKCGKSEVRRGSGYRSNFLTCKTCAMKWHFDCLPITFEILMNARKKFKCEKCRRCVYCTTTKSADKVTELVMCCVCVNVYHLDCHWPPIKPETLNDSKWKCYSCAPHCNLYNTDNNVSWPAPRSPPRKSKAGRKKRATSDPAAGIVKKVATSEDLTKNGIIATESSATSSVTEHVVATVPKEENENSKDSCELETAQRSSPQCSPPQCSPAQCSPTQCSPAQCLPAQSSPTPDTPVASAPAPSLSASTEDKENSENTENTENTENKSPPTTTAEGSEQSALESWNVEKVVSYMERFYPREAGVFKSQEIDGAALMVLTRQDIIDRFGLKLGPALRIYELVLGLQTAIDDITLSWCD